MQEWALVTGGSSGIGYAIARLLAARGYHLVLVSNQEKELAAIKADFEKNFGISVVVVHQDLATGDAALTLHRTCSEKKLTIDILVNNAGMFFFGEAAEADPRKATALVNLHIMTPALLCSLFGKDMKNRRRGRILIISSISAYRDFPGISYYGSSKRFLMSFATSLRCEMREYGVSVTCVCPGAAATSLYGESPIDIQLALKIGIMHTAEQVAAAAVRALFAGKGMIIPGLLNKIMVFLARLTPQPVIDFINHHTDIIPKGR